MMSLESASLQCLALALCVAAWFDNRKHVKPPTGTWDLMRLFEQKVCHKTHQCAIVDFLSTEKDPSHQRFFVFLFIKTHLLDASIQQKHDFCCRLVFPNPPYLSSHHINLQHPTLDHLHQLNPKHSSFNSTYVLTMSQLAMKGSDTAPMLTALPVDQFLELPLRCTWRPQQSGSHGVVVAGGFLVKIRVKRLKFQNLIFTSEPLHGQLIFIYWWINLHIIVVIAVNLSICAMVCVCHTASPSLLLVRKVLRFLEPFGTHEAEYWLSTSPWRPFCGLIINSRQT